MKLQKEESMQRRVSIFNMKGGTGKSTLAVNLAHALALKNQSVLLIDCDLQGNASSILGERTGPTLTDILTGNAQVSQAIYQARENFAVVPADRQLNTAANYIVSKGRKAYSVLHRAVQDLSQYDILLFDHSPSYSTVTEAALLASTELLIPCELAPYPIEGLLGMFNKLQDELDDHQLAIIGIVPFNVDLRYNMTHQYIEELQTTFKDKVTPLVRTDAAIPKAQAYRQTIFEYDAQSKAAQDIQKVVQHLFLGGMTNG